LAVFNKDVLNKDKVPSSTSEVVVGKGTNNFLQKL